MVGFWIYFEGKADNTESKMTLNALCLNKWDEVTISWDAKECSIPLLFQSLFTPGAKTKGDHREA